jgi:4-amino-4-deoxy-L-arabinose transferase-like glycosyltransferase
MNGFIKKYPLAVLMIVSVLMLVSHLGLIQTNIMEARNLISAREMVNNGHWIFTTLNNMPRYEKPPLPTWITAFFMTVFGMQNMFWLRLPVVLVTLLLVYFFYRFCKAMHFKNNHPLNASLILITSFYIFFAGRDNQWDMYTHAFMMPCIFYLFKIFQETKSDLKNILFAGIFFGCSFLSKGPVSFYGLLLPFLIAYFIVYRKNEGRKLLAVLFVLIIGLLIGFSWPLYVKYFDPNIGTALTKQAKNWGNYEVKPFYYYWSFFTQSGLWTTPAVIALMYLYMLRRVQNAKAYTFSFLWTILSVVLLSIIPEKKARYLLPVLIPMAMNTSFYIEYLIADFKSIKSKAEALIVHFTFGLVGLIGMAAPFTVFFLFKSKLNDYIFWYVLFTIVSFSSAFFIIKSLYKRKFAQTFYTIVYFMCGVVVTAIPLSKMYYTNKKYYAASNLHAVEKKYDIKTYEADEFIPEITWDYGTYIPQLSNIEKGLMPADANFGLLGDSIAIANLQRKFSNYSFKKYVEVDLNALSKNEKGYNSRLAKNYYLVQRLY